MPAVLLLLFLSACGSHPRSEASATPTGDPGSTVTVDVGGRPFKLRLPRSYDPATRMPLVVVLHGYTSTAAAMGRYVKLADESDHRGFLFAMPEGTKDARGDRFWNATDACCDFYRSGVDDSGYLLRLIETVTSAYSADPGRVYLVGHSNGGFMAHRFACDHPSAIAGIVSFAGAAPHDPARCAPDRPVSVLQIHGTTDSTIRYEGGSNAGRQYPSALASVELWRRLDGCSDSVSAAPPMDLESTLPGAETTVTAYVTGCRQDSRVELWTITGGEHVPSLTPGFASSVADFLLSHP